MPNIVTRHVCLVKYGWLYVVEMYAYILQTWQISYCNETTEVLCNITNYYRSPGSTSSVALPEKINVEH